MTAPELRRRHDMLVAKRDNWVDELTALTQRHVYIIARTLTVDAAKLLFQEAGERAMASFRDKAVDVCSVAVRDVFGNKWRLKIDFHSRGELNVTQEADVMLVDDEGHETEPMDDNGGGLGDIVSWALRLSLLALRKPPVRPVLVLDEPFRDLSPDLRPLGGEMLRKVSQALLLQVIMTTNEREYLETAQLVIDMEQATKG